MIIIQHPSSRIIIFSKNFLAKDLGNPVGWQIGEMNSGKSTQVQTFLKLRMSVGVFSKSRFGLQSSSNVDETMSSVTWNSEEIDKQITLKSIDELLLENPDTLSDYRDLKGPELDLTKVISLQTLYSPMVFFLKCLKTILEIKTILIRHQAPPANSISVRRNFIILEESSD